MVQVRDFICEATGEPCADGQCTTTNCALDFLSALDSAPVSVGRVSRISDAKRFQRQAEKLVANWEAKKGKKLHRVRRSELLARLTVELTRRAYQQSATG